MSTMWSRKSVTACLVVLAVVARMPASARLFSFSHFKTSGLGRGPPMAHSLDAMKHTPVREALEELEEELRTRRQASGTPGTPGTPRTLGQVELGELYRYGVIHYSGDQSLAIFVMLYNITEGNTLTASSLYRSTNYGVNFTRIDHRLDPSNPNLTLWPGFYVNPVNKFMLVFANANEATIYYTLDEGDSFKVQHFTPNTINPRSLLSSPTQPWWALAHDTTNHQLYVTEDLGAHWIWISDNVANPFDYTWGDPRYDQDDTTIFYNVFDPADRNRGNFTVGLYTQYHPYGRATTREFDPNLGRHDDFALIGPYIFAQKTDPPNNIHLLVSYQRGSFRKCIIPSTDPHQNYYAEHINTLQAMVIVEHYSGMFNLYLSDTTGVDYSLSLQDIVVDSSYNSDLERINGINGTWIANTHVRAIPGVRNASIRTVISFSNGGRWEPITPPDYYKNGTPVSCQPPLCSLHFHMATSAYARLGVYSLDTAPGIIIAHGTIGGQLSVNPDLFISRDGGNTWNQTLEGSWGVSVLDQGGLMVAVRDYHQSPSTELMFSCDEGMTWTSYRFKPSGNMTVYGVITEPGEFTTTVSLYGVERGHSVWQVVTVNFSDIFPRQCVAADYYNWTYWDARLSDDCVLGATVVLKRRRADHCCLNGPGYTREVNFTRCTCTMDDFECDYGYGRGGNLTGPCVRDPAIILDSPCTSNSSTFWQTQGYRKIAGDVCQGGVSNGLSPHIMPCCYAHQASGANVPAIVLGSMLVVVSLIAVVCCVLMVVFMRKHAILRRRHLRLATSGMEPTRERFSFENDPSDREDRPPPSRTADLPTRRAAEDDDDPLLT